ncbi:hypothetical protein BC628DRAFT_1356109 [Trametes gibbosa]|nr:hypothetical protein BC628DRAFT_1356109 [Trametes gibbosa]
MPQHSSACYRPLPFRIDFSAAEHRLACSPLAFRSSSESRKHAPLLPPRPAVLPQFPSASPGHSLLCQSSQLRRHPFKPPSPLACRAAAAVQRLFFPTYPDIYIYRYIIYQPSHRHPIPSVLSISKQQQQEQQQDSRSSRSSSLTAPSIRRPPAAPERPVARCPSYYQRQCQCAPPPCLSLSLSPTPSLAVSSRAWFASVRRQLIADPISCAASLPGVGVPRGRGSAAESRRLTSERTLERPVVSDVPPHVLFDSASPPPLPLPRDSHGQGHGGEEERPEVLY